MRWKAHVTRVGDTTHKSFNQLTQEKTHQGDVDRRIILKLILHSQGVVWNTLDHVRIG